jgi:hypothetical protein
MYATLFHSISFSMRVLRKYLFEGVVTGIQIIPKRLHNMIGHNSDVSCSALDHGQDGSQDSTYSIRTNRLSD